MAIRKMSPEWRVVQVAATLAIENVLFLYQNVI